MNKQTLVLLIIAVAWTVLVPIRLLLSSAWEMEQNASRATATTQAIIIGLELQNHNSVQYEYLVNGVRYSGSQAGMGGRIQEGASILVHYDPQHPSTNYIGDPPPSFDHNLIGLGIVVMFIVLGFSIGFYKIKHSSGKMFRLHKPNVARTMPTK